MPATLNPPSLSGIVELGDMSNNAEQAAQVLAHRFQGPGLYRVAVGKEVNGIPTLVVYVSKQYDQRKLPKRFRGMLVSVCSIGSAW